jgi:hypothetical protein
MAAIAVKCFDRHMLGYTGYRHRLVSDGWWRCAACLRCAPSEWRGATGPARTHRVTSGAVLGSNGRGRVFYKSRTDGTVQNRMTCQGVDRVIAWRAVAGSASCNARWCGRHMACRLSLTSEGGGANMALRAVPCRKRTHIVASIGNAKAGGRRCCGAGVKTPVGRVRSHRGRGNRIQRHINPLVILLVARLAGNARRTRMDHDSRWHWSAEEGTSVCGF